MILNVGARAHEMGNGSLWRALTVTGSCNNIYIIDKSSLFFNDARFQRTLPSILILFQLPSMLRCDQNNQII